MLSQEENRVLTEVGSGTRMGELLRRYWMPIAAVSELDQVRIKRVRLMGEDLVLYRDTSGNYGLVDRHCPHRGADLSFGWVDERGLRCHYHGWHWDRTGKCLAQPFEDVVHLHGGGFKDRVRIKAYKVEAKAGLVWAYLGPDPAPLVPTWEPFTWQNGFVQIVFSEIPCNWVQCQENSIDPVHFEWLHGQWSRTLGAPALPLSSHLKVGFDEIDYGFVYRRIVEGKTEQDALWSIGRTCLWPNCLFTGGHFEWRVPIDDTNTLSVGWFFDRVPNEMEPFTQETIPAWSSPIKDPTTGQWITSHVMNQDFAAWVGQGPIADRTKEHLGESDRGVIQFRKRLFADAEVVANGGDPKGVIRDPLQNQCVTLPVIDREHFVNGYPQADMGKRPTGPLAGFVFQAGQPEAVRVAFRRAMGLDTDAR